VYLREEYNPADLDEIEELLECGDDLLDIEQSAFLNSSKTMLSMIDSMLLAIDQRMEFNLKSLPQS
jgi:hypothetical protein